MSTTEPIESADFMAQAYTRLEINEGFKNTVYRDSMGIPTIGMGFNLQRADADTILASIGADLHLVLEGHPLTDEQVEKLFQYSFTPVIGQARSSLQEFHFDSMSDARKFVICDLVFNMGLEGWESFANTRALIDEACHNLRIGNAAEAHRVFGLAADRLTVSAWASQVGNRAKRDIAMLRSSNWVDPNGDGTY
jgi:GH24 family phage-related lysozyme (muramidase)